MKRIHSVCNRNAGRSRMAEASFDRDAPDDARAESGGSRSEPPIWPEVVEVIRADRRPRKPAVRDLLPA